VGNDVDTTLPLTLTPAQLERLIAGGGGGAIGNGEDDGGGDDGGEGGDGEEGNGEGEGTSEHYDSQAMERRVLQQKTMIESLQVPTPL
jgi:hypothetical protein